MTDTQADLTERPGIDYATPAQPRGQYTPDAHVIADLTERARAALPHHTWSDDGVTLVSDKELGAALQSEREAAYQRAMEVPFTKALVAEAGEAAAAEARRSAIEECAKVARGGGIPDHVDCGHETGYIDGRLDAALAIEALVSPPAPQEDR